MTISFWQSLSRLALLVIPLFISHPLLARQDTAGAVVRVLPATGGYAVGELIQVEVRIVNVENLYGADVQLTFDPSILKVVDADSNLPGVQVSPSDELLSPDWVIKNEADNQAGTVWYAVTQLNPSPEVSGTGALCTFQFSVVGEGSVAVTIDPQLSTRLGEDIPAEGKGAFYTTIVKMFIFLPVVSLNP